MESDYPAANRRPRMPRSRAFLFRSTTGSGIDIAPQNGVAAVARLRAFGLGIVAGSS